MKNRRLYLLLTFLLFASSQIMAQGVRGQITDTANIPLAFATIFVKETGSGTITNENGFYELKLSQGDYTLIFQYLGYKTQIEKVAIGERSRTLDIKLEKQSIDLKQVEVVEGREDPAYTVMRRAIAKASFHRQQLDRYQAKVYIKGSGRLKKYPGIIKPFMEEEEIDTSIAYTTESVSEIEYVRPNTFNEKVISIYETGEDNSTSPNGYINGSFYEPEIAEAISPLSPKAFAYYRFKLDGYFYDRGFGVNKIKVTPRSRGENVFEGHIYIVEDFWSIYSTELSTYKFGIKFLIEQSYAPIEDQVWLPVNHQFSADGKIFGFAFEYNYLATVSDYQIELNPDLENNFTVIDEKLDKELAKEIESIKKQDKNEAEQKLASGEEITRKDLRKLLREYEKEERKQQKEPQVVEEYNFVIDSMARKRDSVYWENIRPVPLTKHEVKGYVKADSLAKAEREAEENNDNEIAEKRRGNRWQPSHLLTGNRYKLSDKEYFAFSSLWDKVLFNPVEGFSLHDTLSYYNYKNHNFSAQLIPRYAFTRKRFSLASSLNYTLGQRFNRTSFSLAGGRYIFQYNEEEPISFFINSFINLFRDNNFIHLYEKEYLKLDFKKSFLEKVKFEAGIEWANRLTLSTLTRQTWFGNENSGYGTNIPFNREVMLPLMERQKALVFNARLITRPWQKYRIRNGERQLIRRSSPTLTFMYKKGIDGTLGSQVNFDQIDFTFQHKFELGVRGLVNVKVNAGTFLNSQAMSFIDFKHFPGNRTHVVTTDPVASFRLLPYYDFSTRREYASAHIHYQFRKFLFTHIPELWLVGIKENLFVNYLATPTSNNYVELGYSIDNILRFFRLETAVAYQDGQFFDIGLLIGIASNLEDLFN